MHRPFVALAALVVVSFTVACSTSPTAPSAVGASAAITDAGTSQGGSQPAAESIKVSKCYTNATVTGGGQMLIKASSSNTSARLFAYRPDGSLIGEVQNGGGSRYGGTVMPYQPYDPVMVTVQSSAGGSVTVPTTPFQP
ncbi:MAG: hypothetical protein U0P30_09465 [Vicinamibacterales bacterium]